LLPLVDEPKSAPRPQRSSGRYETAVATLIALVAVGVSAYTAYVQRQQVRAQVWPILEFGSDNEPELRLWLANKGVGPALIRHVVLTVDGEPAVDWDAAMRHLFGARIQRPGRYSYSQGNISDRVLSAGEKLTFFIPHFDATQGDLRVAFDRDRSRIGVEICYCSTLGDCWTLAANARLSGRTIETRRCPTRSAVTFKQ
jgi:hypothetical protein